MSAHCCLISFQGTTIHIVSRFAVCFLFKLQQLISCRVLSSIQIKVLVRNNFLINCVILSKILQCTLGFDLQKKYSLVWNNLAFKVKTLTITNLRLLIKMRYDIFFGRMLNAFVRQTVVCSAD